MKGTESSFPMMPVSRWWELRERFKKTIPTDLSDSTIASILNIQERSAQNNIMPYLKKIGFINAEGKVNEIAKDWRDDVKYPEVCKKIISEIYPKDLIENYPEPEKEIDGVKRWFAHASGAGDSAVSKMATFYLTLASGKILEIGAKVKKEKVQIEKAKNHRKEIKPSIIEKDQEMQKEDHKEVMHKKTDIHIDLQIHISPELSLEQIDKIFESIAKHLNK